MPDSRQPDPHVMNLFRKSDDGPVPVMNEGPTAKEIDAARVARRTLVERLRERLRRPSG